MTFDPTNPEQGELFLEAGALQGLPPTNELASVADELLLVELPEETKAALSRIIHTYTSPVDPTEGVEIDCGCCDHHENERRLATESLVHVLQTMNDFISHARDVRTLLQDKLQEVISRLDPG